MKHIFVCTLADGSNAQQIQPSNWNDVHCLTPRPISASTSGLENDDWIQAIGGSGGISYTLYSTPTTGQVVLVMKVDAGAGAVTVFRATTETINSLNALGETSYLLINPGQYVELTYDGSNWWVTNSN
jgi:hypothetical protein